MKSIHINTKRESNSFFFRIILYIVIILILTSLSIILSVFLKKDFTFRNINEVYSYLEGSSVEFIIPFKQYELSFENNIDQETRTAIIDSLRVMSNGEKERFSFVENSEYKVGLEYLKDNSDNLGYTYLVFVGHPYWITDGIKDSELSKYKFVVNKEQSKTIKPILTSYINADIEIIENDNIPTFLEKNEGKYIGVIEFDDLNDKLKLLELNSKYFLDDISGGIKVSYTLSDNIPDHIVNAAYKNSNINLELDKSKLLKINMTGVTAISRRLGVATQKSGSNSYAADKIYKFLSNADLVHTSNEVSFAENCIPNPATMRFCAVPSHIETLKKLGVNIVELTGNHNNDFGSSNNTSTIETYKKLGWDYYGGGLNSTDAAKPLIKDIKGSKVAFLGYNYYDTMLGTGALASSKNAGANSFSNEKMKKDIESIRKDVDTIIITFQFQECYSYPEHGGIYPICYKPLSSPDQKKVFRTAIDYGADIVIGSQAHQPQTFEVYKDKMIYYGLGNLLFDQTPWIGTRQGIILSHYVYKGKVLQTKITTTYYDDDLKPYVTTGTQRELLLKLLRDAR